MDTNCFFVLTEGLFRVKNDLVVWQHPCLGCLAQPRDRSKTFDQQQYELMQLVQASFGARPPQPILVGPPLRGTLEQALNQVREQRTQVGITFLGSSIFVLRPMDDHDDAADDEESGLEIAQEHLLSPAVVEFLCDPFTPKVGLDLKAPLLSLLNLFEHLKRVPSGFHDLQVLAYKLALGTTRIADLRDLAGLPANLPRKRLALKLGIAMGVISLKPDPAALPNDRLALSAVAPDRDKKYTDYATAFLVAHPPPNVPQYTIRVL